MRIQELYELLKAAYIESAVEQLRDQGLTVNTSRLSVVTGLQRRDIKRLSAAEVPVPPTASLMSRVLGQWQGDARFLDAAGAPRPLEAEGAQSEFAELVRSVSVDVNPYTLLFGLEQAGAVRREGKRVALAAQALDAHADSAEGLRILAADAESLFKSVSENIAGESGVPNLHLTTEYDNICSEDLPRIREWLLDRGTAFHEEARAYLSKFDKDLNPRLHGKTGGSKVRVTAFSLVEGKEMKK